MKKIILIVALICMFVLTACGNDTDEKKVDENTSTETDSANGSEQNVEVDKNLLSVEVTIPASMVESTEDTLAAAEEEGLKVTENEDGSLTYKMSKAKHKELLSEIGSQIDQSIEEYKTSGDFVSIQDVVANKDYSEFTVVVNEADYENSMDGFIVLGLGVSGMMYQLYDGKSADNYNVEINVENENGEVLSTVNYPEALEELENMEVE
ncbi:hypothetical protein ACFOZ1_10385 [Gracilibacillus marinus]|uniref:Antigen I/II N-terminal domain-containing protein n=1 Tax=Gracilibacillus marinus TaxID=630535 RepID=A0ABV8VUL9_9BACI